MARIHLRDVCDHLSASVDVDGVVDALLAYLRAYQGDWHPTLAMVDGQHDALTRVWSREQGRMDHRDLVLPVDHLPARLVRKFFRPSAFFNATERRSLLNKVFRATPVYEPDRFEVAQVQPLAAAIAWQSCIVLPLADQHDLLALLVIVSPRRGAFPAALVEEVLAIHTMAAVALARRMHAEGRPTPEARQAEEQSRRAQGMFQERLRELESEVTSLTEEVRKRTERGELLARGMERIQAVALQERSELDLLRLQSRALEEQASTAALHLTDAYTQLANAQQRLNDQRETMAFLREVFEAAQAEYDASRMSRALVQRFCEAFAVDRCSLMRLHDDSGGELHIEASRGMDPAMAGQVRLPLGQGVAGWVAHHRKPVLMRKTGDASPVRPTGVDNYNSGSFVSVPLIHKNRLLGVLNLSNKRDGKAFDETDLDRAMMASAVLSMAMGEREEAQGQVARAVAGIDTGVALAEPDLSTPPLSLERDLPPFELRG
jgi:transcriptional regulator with GAF, ATPase, and Fis domain